MAVDTRTALLDHAEAATRSQGFDGFSFADLASAVNIRKASVHYHFPSKADLAVDVMARYRERFAQVFDDIDAKSKTGAERLRAMLAIYRDALDDGSKLCLCAALSASPSRLSASVLLSIEGFRKDMSDWLQAAFEQGRTDGSVHDVNDPEMEARAMLAVMEGAQLSARAAKDSTRFDTAVSCLMGRFSRS